MDKDKVTYHVSRAINILFLYNAVGTSFGILVGVTVMGVQTLIAQYFPPFGLIKWYFFITLGIIIFNIKPFITKKYLDPEIERLLAYIRQTIKEGNFTESEERRIWREVIELVMAEYNHVANNDENLNNPTPE